MTKDELVVTLYDLINRLDADQALETRAVIACLHGVVGAVKVEGTRELLDTIHTWMLEKRSQIKEKTERSKVTPPANHEDQPPK